MDTLINIDNGGTLTDICVWDGGDFTFTKTLTTPHDLSQCLFDGIEKASTALYGAPDTERLLHATQHIRYSTTQGTNAPVSYTHLDVYKRQSSNSLVRSFATAVWGSRWSAKPASVEGRCSRASSPRCSITSAITTIPEASLPTKSRVPRIWTTWPVARVSVSLAV